MPEIDRIEATIAILNHMANVDTPLGVTEIARELDMNKVNVHRILKSLENTKWISQDKNTRKYQFGSQIYQFSLYTVSKMEIQNISLPKLYELSHISGESAQLSLRTGTERMFAQDITGNKEIRLREPLGIRLPLWSGATGRSMLAFFEENEIEEVIRLMKNSNAHGNTLKPLSERELRQELKKIKKDGYAVSEGELQPDICAIAAPIIDASNLVVGAISIRGLLPRFDKKKAEIYSTILMDTVKKIGHSLSMHEW